MNEDTIKLLQDRVLEAAARIRGLRAERDGRSAECDALRARVGEFERDGRRIDLEKIRSALRDAIRDLREGAEAGDDPGDPAESRRNR